MTDFDYEVRERKQLARNAKYRKCGSKSKKCSLPSDRMTEKQWKERNGKVSTVKLNEPMLWGQFKELAPDLQGEYLNNLIQTYGVNAIALSEMFGVTPLSVRNYIRNGNMGVKFKKGAIMTDEQKRAWQNFNDPESTSAEETQEESAMEPAVVEPEVPVCQNEPEIVEVMSEEAKPNETAEVAQLTQFSMAFEGLLNTNMIANSIRGIIGEGRVGKLQIIYEK